MLRLFVLLCVGMFLTLLIGGTDRGQVRFGLRDAPPPTDAPVPAPVPEVAVAAVEPAAAPVAAPQPVAATAPAANPQPTVLAEEASAPIPVAATAQPAETLQDPVFSLANFAAREPIPGAEAAATEPPQAAAAAPVVWVVNSRAINVREGPGTDYGVVGRLAQGEQTLVLEETGDGWARIRIEGDGIEGYVALRLLRRVSE